MMKLTSKNIRLYNKYEHFSYQEILDFTKGNVTKHQKNSYYKFIMEYPDLYDLERTINSNWEVMKDKTIAKWYIYKLIEQGRIKLNLKSILYIKPYTYANVMNISNLVDRETLNGFKKVALNVLKFPEDMIKNAIVPSLIRFLLFYQEYIDDSIKYVEEYYDLLKTKKDNGDITYYHYSYFLKTAKVLAHMDYKIDIFNQSYKNKNKINKPLSIHTQFNEGISKYDCYLKEFKAEKTRSTEISHIRKVVLYLEEYYPKIDQFYKINNEHITMFVQNQQEVVNIFNRHNAPETINHRVESFERLFNYLREMEDYGIKHSISTRYDKLKEPSRFAKHYSQKDILNIIKAVVAYEADEIEEQHKMVLYLLITTGRRISEILNLEYDCLKDDKFFLGHVKNKKGGWKQVIDIAIDTIKNLQSIVKEYKVPLYSPFDKRTVRRLIPSLYYKGVSIVSEKKMESFFYKIQIQNEIVDINNKPLFTLHDNKRNFVTAMLNIGISPVTISKYLNQNLNNLIPYEANNQVAIEVLKEAERMGLLEGKDYISKDDGVKDKITILLDDINVIERHRTNLIFKINNPKTVMPLALGYCSDYNNYNVCSDIICISCDDFFADNVDDLINYANKMYKYIYSFGRDTKIKGIEKFLIEALGKSYKTINGSHNPEGFNKMINKIKKSVRKELADGKERR